MSQRLHEWRSVLPPSPTGSLPVDTAEGWSTKMPKVPRYRVYVAGPITGPKENKDRYETISANLSMAFAVGDQLLKAGYAPFVPHYSHYWNLMYKNSYQDWLDYDRCWLLVSDAILRLPGGSEGADMEVQWALVAGIPVYYSVEALRTAMPAGGLSGTA